MPTWFATLLLGLLVLVAGLIVVAAFKRWRRDPIPYDDQLDGPDSTMYGTTTQMPDEIRHGA